eukprot:PhF_6_TR25152/c0_g1_i2/m.34653
MSTEDPRLRMLRRKAIDKMMEAAFENDLDTVKEIMEDPELKLPIDPKPIKDVPPENSLLGEAACANAVDVVKYALSRGADPNYVGEKQRVPLYRAIHNNAVDVVPLLLEAGADPRLLMIQPRDPQDPSIILFREYDAQELMRMGFSDEVKAILSKWNIATTLAILEKRKSNFGGSSGGGGGKADDAEAKAKITAMKDKYSQLMKAVESARERERTAFHHREEMIKVYDIAKCEKKTDQELAVQEELIKKAETAYNESRIALDELEFHAKKERTKCREEEVTFSGGLQFLTNCTLNDLPEVMVRGTLARHPYLVVDTPAHIAMSFMTYRDVFTVRDIGRTSHFDNPEAVRVDLLKCLRYGKVYVVDARDYDLGEVVIPKLKAILDKIHPTLYDLIKTRAIVEKKNYEAVLLNDDKVTEANPDLAKAHYRADYCEKFTFSIVTADPYPNQELLDEFGSIRVVA